MVKTIICDTCGSRKTESDSSILLRIHMSEMPPGEYTALVRRFICEVLQTQEIGGRGNGFL